MSGVTPLPRQIGLPRWLSGREPDRPLLHRRFKALLGGLAPLVYIYLGWVLLFSLAGLPPTYAWTLAVHFVIGSVSGPLAYCPDLGLLLFGVGSIYVLLTLGTRFGDLPWFLHAMCTSVWYLAPTPLYLGSVGLMIT